MSAWQLLLVTGLLLIVLLWHERVTRPPETAEQILARMALTMRNLAVVIGTQFVPAIEKAAQASKDFAVAWEAGRNSK